MWNLTLPAVLTEADCYMLEHLFVFPIDHFVCMLLVHRVLVHRPLVHVAYHQVAAAAPHVATHYAATHRRARRADGCLASSEYCAPCKASLSLILHT